MRKSDLKIGQTEECEAGKHCNLAAPPSTPGGEPKNDGRTLGFLAREAKMSARRWEISPLSDRPGACSNEKGEERRMRIEGLLH